MADLDFIRKLVKNPSELLSVELKAWIDPETPEGKSKIVRTCFALRNRDGGHMLIGFEDSSGKALLDEAPENVEDTFNIDKIQGIISKYASALFEVEVVFEEVSGKRFPVIVVPSGVRFPIAAKADITTADNHRLVKMHDVYFRTLRSNGTPSTSVIFHTDWPEITEICLNNREADIGGFLRRQLGGADFGQFADIIQSLASSPNLSIGPQGLCDKVEVWLHEGHQRFEVHRIENADDTEAVPYSGTWSCALFIDPPKEGPPAPSQSFLNTINSANPRLTGWPTWAVMQIPDGHTVFNGGWEYFRLSYEKNYIPTEFQRIEPAGRFYIERSLEDDMSTKVEPGKFLEPILTMLRTAEAMAVGLALAKALGWDPAETTLGFLFKWSGLKGRRLQAWAHPMIFLELYQVTATDEFTRCIEIPLETSPDALAPYVHEVMSPLFAEFDGTDLSMQAAESWVKRLVTRTL